MKRKLKTSIIIREKSIEKCVRNFQTLDALLKYLKKENRAEFDLINVY